MVTGIVQIEEIWGEVITAIDLDTTGASLQILPDGGPAVPITNPGGVDISSLAVGSFLGKTCDASIPLAAADSLGANIAESIYGNTTSFKVIEGDGLDTTIQMVTGGTGNSGRIRWHARWTPLSEDGTISPA